MLLLQNCRLTNLENIRIPLPNLSLLLLFDTAVWDSQTVNLYCWFWRLWRRWWLLLSRLSFSLTIVFCNLRSAVVACDLRYAIAICDLQFRINACDCHLRLQSLSLISVFHLWLLSPFDFVQITFNQSWLVLWATQETFNFSQLIWILSWVSSFIFLVGFSVDYFFIQNPSFCLIDYFNPV